MRAAEVVKIRPYGNRPEDVEIYAEDPKTGKLTRFLPTRKLDGRKAEIGGYAIIKDNGIRTFESNKDFVEGYAPIDPRTKWPMRKRKVKVPPLNDDGTIRRRHHATIRIFADDGTLKQDLVKELVRDLGPFAMENSNE